MKRISQSLIIVFAILLAGCGNKAKQTEMPKIDNEQISSGLQQSDDLLIGLSSAICYSGFRSGQHPDRGEGAKNPTDEQIMEDLNILKEAGFGLIRLYDSGVNSESVLSIIQEHKLPIKVMLGIWLQAELSNHESCAWLTEPIPQAELDENKALNQKEIQRGIDLANKYLDVVVALNVGNEALVDWNDHKVDTDTIIAYVQKVKASVKQAVTVAENYEWWAAKGEKLAAAVDFVAIHIYPVWEGKDIDEAMSYSIQNVEKVRKTLPDSKIVISEAGWASAASEFGERASEEKQLQYYNDLMLWAAENNVTTFFFEAFDEDWKGNPDNPMGAEKHWGLYTVDRTPKKVMK